MTHFLWKIKEREIQNWSDQIISTYQIQKDYILLVGFEILKDLSSKVLKMSTSRQSILSLDRLGRVAHLRVTTKGSVSWKWAWQTRIQAIFRQHLNFEIEILSKNILMAKTMKKQNLRIQMLAENSLNLCPSCPFSINAAFSASVANASYNIKTRLKVFHPYLHDFLHIYIFYPISTYINFWIESVTPWKLGLGQEYFC